MILDNREKRNSTISNHNSGRRDTSGRLSTISSNNIIGSESIEDLVRKMNAKILTLTDRLNRLEDQRGMGSGKDGKSQFFPKIEGSKGSSAPSFDIVKG